jgi:hypothetical protein
MGYASYWESILEQLSAKLGELGGKTVIAPADDHQILQEAAGIIANAREQFASLERKNSVLIDGAEKIEAKLKECLTILHHPLITVVDEGKLKSALKECQRETQNMLQLRKEHE